MGARPIRGPYAEGILAGVLAPLLFVYVKRRVDGREVLGEEIAAPVIFVANHCSHLDTPTILRAMPANGATGPRSPQPPTTSTSRAGAPGASRSFSTPSRSAAHGGGLGNGASDHVDKLIEEGWSLLMFPEGTRSRDGEIGKVHSGAAVLAAQHRLSIVPIWVGGTREAMPPGQNWPKRRPRLAVLAPRQGGGALRVADPAARPVGASRGDGASPGVLGARGPAGEPGRAACGARRPDHARGPRSP